MHLATGIGVQTEEVSWWPKHHAWIKGSSYTGIWTTLDEYWFQQRLGRIYKGEAAPLNCNEWIQHLRKNKSTGHLADAVDEHSWNFIYRNFVDNQSQRPSFTSFDPDGGMM